MSILNYPDPYQITFGLNPGSGNVANPFSHWDLLIPDLKLIGIRKVRFQLSWDSIETPQGTFNWGALDDAVSHFNSNGIHMTFPFRGAPSFYSNQASQKATDEPWFLANPSDFANFCSIVATRYDGTHGHGQIDRFEVCNEEANIHNTDPTYTFTLQTDIPNGTNGITSFNISAPGNTILAGAVIQFGAWNGTGQKITVSSDVGKNATSINVNSFNSNQHYTVGSTITVQYAAIHASTSPYWGNNAGDLVTGVTKYRPGRSPQYYVPILLASYAAIKAVVPDTPVGMAAMWWMQPTGDNIYNQPLSQPGTFLKYMYDNGCKGKFDYVNWHYYSNTTDDGTGSKQTIKIVDLISELKTIVHNAGDTVNAKITEFGWQVGPIPPNDVQTGSEQWQQYITLLEAARTSNFVDEVSIFTMGYNPNFGTGSSLTSLDGGVVTYRQPTFPNMQNYIAQYPIWAINPPFIPVTTGNQGGTGDPGSGARGGHGIGSNEPKIYSLGSVGRGFNLWQTIKRDVENLIQTVEDFLDYPL